MWQKSRPIVSLPAKFDSYDKIELSMISKAKKLFELFLISLKLGVTSFGGPIAHLGYFHHEYIEKRQWMDEESYADLVALCQFLPGPASSQLGIGIGTIRDGLLGGIIAWIGFTLPSALLLVLFAYLLKDYNFSGAAWLHGLKIVAVVIVAQAVITMWKKLIPTKTLAVLALFSMVFLLFWHAALSQIAIISIAALLGLCLYPKTSTPPNHRIKLYISPWAGLIALFLFVSLLFALPVARYFTHNHWIAMTDSYYRSGALVFGGGHVVLPMLEKEVVLAGWVSKENFLAGYGATQAVPGPLFTFSAYLGAMSDGLKGAALALGAIFLPGFLLIIGALPFWNRFRKNSTIRGAFMGINAAVVGILLAALYQPLWTSSILSIKDFGLAAVLFVLLMYWKLPPWVIVITGALGATLLHQF